MSADLIGDDACREAFNKARQQRFSVHGLDVVCEPDIFRSGYAAGRDSEIAKRDARMAELEKELQAGATAVENCELFRAELAAIKAQAPAFMWHKGATEDESEVVDVDCACPCCVPLYAAPVSEAKAQGVVIPPSPYMPGSQPTDFTDYELGEIHGRIAMWEEVKRLNAAPVQQPKCKTCDDNGRIGGPSFYAPDEGGDPCPDCCAPVQQVSVPDGSRLVTTDWLKRIHRDLDACQKLIWANLRGCDPSYYEDAQERLREIDAMLTAAPAAPAADAGLVDMYSHLQKVTPYRFKKIQDAAVTYGGDVLYFHKDRFDAALLDDMAANCAKESK